MNEYASAFFLASMGGIICGKWAMELGFGQFRQVLWGIAGFFVPPLIMLILYVRLIRVQLEKEHGELEMRSSLAKDL